MGGDTLLLWGWLAVSGKAHVKICILLSVLGCPVTAPASRTCGDTEKRSTILQDLENQQCNQIRENMTEQSELAYAIKYKF